MQYKKCFVLRLNDLIKIETQRKCAKHREYAQFLYDRPILSIIISTRARKRLVNILNFQPRFLEEVAKLSKIGCKDFARRLRDNFILGGADLLEGFY